MLCWLIVGYPHTIKKSAILSIAPHSWPQLCHALVWLTRCLAEMDDYNTPTTEFSVSPVNLYTGCGYSNVISG